MLEFAGRSAATGAYLPMLVSVIFVTIIIFVLEIVARIVNTTCCTDSWFVAICVMLDSVEGITAICAFKPMVIGIVFVATIVMMLNFVAGIINAATCTNSWLIAICIMHGFIRIGTTTCTFKPMEIGIEFIVAIVMMLDCAAGVVNAAFCTDIGIVAICPMISCVNSSIAFRTFEPMTITI